MGEKNYHKAREACNMGKKNYHKAGESCDMGEKNYHIAGEACNMGEKNKWKLERELTDPVYVSTHPIAPSLRVQRRSPSPLHTSMARACNTDSR